MHRYDPARRKLALGLAFLAGAVDATGFIRTGGYFASFMSGNTTRLGLHIAGELCEANGARLVPVAQTDGACFRITFARAWSQAANDRRSIQGTP